MGKTVFIFPGQGSQYVGMGKVLWDAHEEVRRLYGMASGLTGRDLASVSFEGPAHELDEDLTAQLTVYVCNEAHRLAAVKAGLAPQAVTGYSMGFYSALVAANALSFGDGLKAVAMAGNLALEQSAEVPGTMAAVIGLDIAEVEAICREAVADAGVWVSNVNAARQILISGGVQDVERAVALSLERGALSAYRLQMGAAYHSPLMDGAVNKFSRYLSGVDFKRPLIPALSYLDAKYLDAEGDIRSTVAGQLSMRVLWKDSVLRLITDGFDNFIEVGPGSALSRMVRWVDRGVRVTPAEAMFMAKQ